MMTETIIVAILGSGVLSAIVSGIFNLTSVRKKGRSATDKLIMGMAYNSIIDRCEKYIERGYISTDEFNELDRYLYQPYAQKGGNGTAAKLMAEVGKLPMKEVNSDD